MSVRLLVGDVFDQLADLPADSVDCVVTSPPYWGLRDYDVAGQIGLEPTLAEHLDVMVRVFRAVRRVMKPAGTLWLNYGDCYASTPNGRSAAATKVAGNDDRTFRDKPFSTIGGALKAKDLCMIPNRLAIALQEDGWWVRSEIIWGKPNPMPDSSGRYRPSTAHEKIWLLTKSAKSYYDSESVRMPPAEASLQRWAQDVESQQGSARANAGRKTNGNLKAVGGPRSKGNSNGYPGSNKDGVRKRSTTGNVPNESGSRLLRNYEPDLSAIVPPAVWEIATRGFAGAHFATFPPALVAPCIMAGCPEGGLVLDPFGGAGTTGLVADRLGRDAILIELNPDYAEIAERRLTEDAGMLADVALSEAAE